ncbi:hypothetical protein [Roseateles sp.]|uniref:hypothetical protein n=1 Tax=Roseateles sp. TaxID=1971397 RepID=UPI00394B3F91
MKKWLAILLLAGIAVAAYLASWPKGPSQERPSAIVLPPELKHSERSVEKGESILPNLNADIVPLAKVGEGTASVRDELDRHSNFRALIHDMLKIGDRQSILIALGAIDRCTLSPHSRELFPEDKLKSLNVAVALRWEKMVSACGAGGGIDSQQIRAVVAMMRSRFPDLAYLSDSLQGTTAERDAIDSISTGHHAAARWIDKKLENQTLKMTFIDGKAAPQPLASLAIQIEACSVSACDSTLAFVNQCVGQPSLCSLDSFADQVEYSFRQDKSFSPEEWKHLRTQAREALRKNFPKLMLQVVH